jgi:hypothetical protein
MGCVPSIVVAHAEKNGAEEAIGDPPLSTALKKGKDIRNKPVGALLLWSYYEGFVVVTDPRA